MDAFSVVKDVARRTDACILSFSTGSDSQVCLHLLAKHFKRVVLMHFYPVEGLEINEAPLRYAASRYGCEVHKYLDPDVCSMLRQRGMEDVPKYTREDVVNLVRTKTGIKWAAFGFLCGDSFTRGMWMRQVSGADVNGKRFYPLFRWKKQHVEAYIRMHDLRLPKQYAYGFRELGSLKGTALIFLKRNFPRDYAILANAYPFIEHETFRMEMQE